MPLDQMMVASLSFIGPVTLVILFFSYRDRKDGKEGNEGIPHKH